MTASPSWLQRSAQRLRVALGVPSRKEARQDLELALARRAKSDAKRIDRLEQNQREIRRLLRRLITEQAQDPQAAADRRSQGERIDRIGSGVASLVRGQALGRETLPFPQSLISRRFRGWSQNEEDGITLALFDLIGHGSRRFVEIGAGTNGGNTGYLARECGWTGLMVEGERGRVERLRRRFGGSGVQTVAAMVTRENVNELLAAHGMQGEIDFLSIDIDSNDYWIWQALTVCTPRVVIVEYNGAWGHHASVVVPYDPHFNRHKVAIPGGRYYGASLRAYIHLAEEKGFRFLTTEPRGINAYFVRNDIALPEYQPRIPGGDPETALLRDVRESGLPLVRFD